jgi:hypothetical protein
MFRARSIAAWCLLGVAACASAEPFEIQVRTPNARALQQAIDACPRSYSERQQGCQIRLPAGTIRGSWKIGGYTGSNVQVGVCLIGQGPGHASTWPEGKVGASGTTLVYEGPPGGTLLDFEGGDHPCVQDVTLRMDGAAVGLRLRGGNTPIQNPALRRVAIAGSMKRPDGIGLLITGTEKNNQVDALLADELKIDNVAVGIEVDSHQAVTNRIGAGSKISARDAAVRIRGGSLSLDGVLVQCGSKGCCTYDLLSGHGYLRVRDGYHEVGLPAPDIKVLCLNRGSPDGVGSWHMVSITESYFNVQCDAARGPCFVDFLNGRSNTGVVFRDNFIGATNPATDQIGRTFVRIAFASPVGGSTGKLIWEGNSVAVGMGGIRAEIGPRTQVQALTSDGQRLWNDTNLNGRFDPSEPSIPSAPAR